MHGRGAQELEPCACIVAGAAAPGGVRLVWVVHPETCTVDVYRPDGGAVTLAETDALDELDVLSGFTCEVSAVFGPPPAEEHPGE